MTITKDTGEGTPLVFIHGFAVNSLIMQALEDTIDFSGWRRIYLDLPWTRQGLDTSIDSSDAVLSAVEKELHHYLGEEPFALVGNSFGAMISRGLAHQHKDKVLGLATLAGVFEPISDKRTVPEKSVIVCDSDFISTLGADKEDFLDISVIQDRPNYERFKKFVEPGFAEADSGVMEAISERYALSYVPEEQATERFTAPALHLFGKQDHLVGYEDGLKWVNHYERGTFVVLNEAGHNVHLEQPQVVKGLFETWLHQIKGADF